MADVRRLVVRACALAGLTALAVACTARPVLVRSDGGEPPSTAVATAPTVTDTSATTAPSAEATTSTTAKSTAPSASIATTTSTAFPVLHHASLGATTTYMGPQPWTVSYPDGWHVQDYGPTCHIMIAGTVISNYDVQLPYSATTSCSPASGIAGLPPDFAAVEVGLSPGRMLPVTPDPTDTPLPVHLTDLTASDSRAPGFALLTTRGLTVRRVGGYFIHVYLGSAVSGTDRGAVEGIVESAFHINATPELRVLRGSYQWSITTTPQSPVHGTPVAFQVVVTNPDGLYPMPQSIDYGDGTAVQSFPAPGCIPAVPGAQPVPATGPPVSVRTDGTTDDRWVHTYTEAGIHTIKVIPVWIPDCPGRGGSLR